MLSVSFVCWPPNYLHIRIVVYTHYEVTLPSFDYGPRSEGPDVQIHYSILLLLKYGCLPGIEKNGKGNEVLLIYTCTKNCELVLFLCLLFCLCYVSHLINCGAWANNVNIIISYGWPDIKRVHSICEHGYFASCMCEKPFLIHTV